jgi:hypothetical protein
MRIAGPPMTDLLVIGSQRFSTAHRLAVQGLRLFQDACERMVMTQSMDKARLCPGQRARTSILALHAGIRAALGRASPLAQLPGLGPGLDRGPRHSPQALILPRRPERGALAQAPTFLLRLGLAILMVIRGSDWSAIPCRAAGPARRASGK